MPRRNRPIAAEHATAFTRIAAFLLALVMTAFFAVMTSTSAQAESRTCKRLERQLASLGSGRGRSSKRVSRAIRGQQKQIGIAKRRLKRLGCTKRRLFFFRDSHPSCKGLRGALQRMRNNLASLKAQGGSGRSTRSTKRQRSKIRRAMRRNECGVTRNAKRQDKETISDQIFGEKSRTRDRKLSRKERRRLRKQDRQRQRDKRLALLKAEEKERRLQTPSTVRTMCVRTCDGYYFPVSLSSKRGRKGGAAACDKLCPGTEMRLYVHKKAGQDPKRMVSLASGKPYSALPTAFAYQKSFNPNCSCNFRKAVNRSATVAGDDNRKKVSLRTAKRAVQKTAMPIWRPDGAADPETAANRRGKLDLAALGSPNEKRPFDQISQRNVRIIGETFLPAR